MTRRRAIVAAIWALGAGLVGCQKVDTSAPAWPSGVPGSIKLLDVARQLTAAIKADSCSQLASLAYYPQLPPARCHLLVQRLPAQSVGHVKDYGSAGVAQLSLAHGRYATAVFIVGRTLEWRYALAVPTLHPSSATPPLPSQVSQGAREVATVLRGVGAGSCAKIASAFPPLHGAGGAFSPANCFGRVGSPFAMLVKQGTTSPSLIGGNSRILFYLARAGTKHIPFVFVLVLVRGKPRYLAQYRTPEEAATVKLRARAPS